MPTTWPRASWSVLERRRCSSNPPGFASRSARVNAASSEVRAASAARPPALGRWRPRTTGSRPYGRDRFLRGGSGLDGQVGRRGPAGQGEPIPEEISRLLGQLIVRGARSGPVFTSLRGRRLSLEPISGRALSNVVQGTRSRRGSAGRPDQRPLPARRPRHQRRPRRHRRRAHRRPDPTPPPRHPHRSLHPPRTSPAEHLQPRPRPLSNRHRMIALVR